MKRIGHINILIIVAIFMVLLSSCVYEDLSAPTGVNAQARVEQVYIEWSKVKDAKSYTIYFSTTPNQKIGKKTRIMGIKNTYYNHNGLTGYKTYYYTVVAVDEEGFNSDESIEVDATPDPFGASSSSSSDNNNNDEGRSSTSSDAVRLPKTGQTTSYASNDDGALQRGLSWPSPRFTVSGDCVTDNMTGLMWPKDGNIPGGTRTWSNALTEANNLSLCGYDDWRLPNVNELESLVNSEQSNPATWLNGQGFTGVQSGYYWSSTTYASNTGNAWNVYMYNGYVYNDNKTSSYYVWPVRSGQ